MRCKANSYLIVFTVLLYFMISCSRTEKDDKYILRLVYTQPTPIERFEAALPIGNGRLGAKIYGNVNKKIINLNDATLWSGMPGDDNAPSVKDRIREIRDALVEGDFYKAQKLSEGLSSHDNQSYQPLGNIYLDFSKDIIYTDYSRELNLDNAVITVKYNVDGVNYTREIFASYPDQVIVMHIFADRKGSVNFTASMDTQLQGTYSVETGSEIVVCGRAPKFVKPKSYAEWDPNIGTGFESRLKIIPVKGEVVRHGDSLSVCNSDEAVLIFSSATEYAGARIVPFTDGQDCSAVVCKHLDDAVRKGYKKLYADHVNDYQPLFRRVYVEINGDKENKYAKAYQWARYNLLACSREGSIVPRNEQGIWNRDVLPHYASNFTLNENPQKYYVLAETGNIPEAVAPLIRFTEALAINGRETAELQYGFRGWVAHHNSDVWAKTTMATGRPCWSVWPMGGVWLCQHVWERYAYGQDETYLRETAYPLLKGAALFCLDLLIENQDGYLATAPSTSPENSFLDNQGNRLSVDIGCTADIAFVSELFEHCMEACGILNADPEFRKEIENAYARLAPYKIGSKGQLLEYSQEFEEFEPHHRHASHLISVWPLSQITKEKTPELFYAARVSLELRASGGYHPDKAGMWARLLDGDECLKALKTNYPVMYDTPFGGLAEMLLQSHTGYIDILPALPTDWHSGKVSGLRARGNYEIDMEWNDGELVSATIKSFCGNTPMIRVKGEEINIINDKRIKLI
ncbi:MAG: glycoside hydrolase family 95 protein [Rikenellaceae bacterium]|nr:glycoside hydrolase family 95 protein [Rikenellaceae bacterium]